MKKILLLSITLFLLGSIDGISQQLVYQPKNPVFGGNNFNYQWMLASAQSQDTTKDPDAVGSNQFGFNRSPLDDFAESLNRQILSRLSRELVTRQFGESALENGTYTLGDYQIEIGQGGSGVSVTIVDTKTGATTVVEVPFN
ncbi:curli assembly protein CsgF [Belliella sp. R4-6]|uniref:Curli production assembly/transport component CsgF n=1 Tax=Belliella alkalica TaxID=1730871 RepID=A0ABS9VE13_9BACT|nr:curli production assembly/transport component CsgF [Belliella alkalica]MCH7414657.1 curli assembly protein CsgF [Belliella alkalica]